MNRQHVATRLLSRRFVQGAGLAGLGLLAGCGRLPGQALGLTIPQHVLLQATEVIQ
ncbi:MAG TPA: hypothetical protein VII06_10370 [Chloroflexota bacterium]|jgi:hypothetical protein